MTALMTTWIKFAAGEFAGVGPQRGSNRLRIVLLAAGTSRIKKGSLVVAYSAISWNTVVANISKKILVWFVQGRW
jgi:hypothetical protein